VIAEQRRKERVDRGIKVRADSIYALMSWRELSYLTLPRLVLIVGLLVMPFVMPSMYWQRVISIVCIYSLLALSFDFLAHCVGLWEGRFLWERAATSRRS
jgi:branched-chain amino acid transport system permease protein